MKYPWFSIVVMWTYEEEGVERGFNSSSNTRIFRVEPTEGELEDWRKTMVEAQLEHDKTARDFNIVIERLGETEWCLTWFEHYTFDEGQSDREVLQSFDRFVADVQDANRELDEYERRCLMGAEDRWRWSGEDRDEHDPPCRCEHCKKQGIIRIGH